MTKEQKDYYYFHELPTEDEKSNAAYEVYEKEFIDGEYDYDIENEDIDEDMKELIRETGLEITEFRWWDNYGIGIDMSSTSMTNDYLLKVLTAAEMQHIDCMNAIGVAKHYLFSDDLTVDYLLDFDYFQVDFSKWMQFFQKLSDNEDQKNYFKVMSAFEDNEDVIKDLTKEVLALADNLTDVISKKIQANIKELKDKIIDSIRKQKDYLESEKFFYEALKNSDYFVNKYQFNPKGEIIRVDGNYTEEYLEQINELDNIA